MDHKFCLYLTIFQIHWNIFLKLVKSFQADPNQASFALQGVDDYPITKVKFNGSCLGQDSISFIHENIVNLYIFHKLDTWSRDLNTDFILGNCFFGDAKLAKNADPYKCGYSDCGVGFDVHSKLSWSEKSCDKKVIVFLCMLAMKRKIS